MALSLKPDWRVRSTALFLPECVSHHGNADQGSRHSLPNFRRYPADQGDWDILLNRQNTILTDLFTNGSPILIVTGDHKPPEGYIELHPLEDVKSIKSFTFTPLEPIDLHSLSQQEYEKGQIYIPMFTQQIWQHQGFNEILKDIAEEDLEAFFISVENNCIVSPYDGGMDIILKDSPTRDFYKTKYEQWLSPREDGF